MKARDVMTPNPFAVEPADRISRVAETMRYERVGAIPVVRDLDTPVLEGMITGRDIAVRCVSRLHGATCLVRDHMTPAPLETVLPDADVSEIAEKMSERDIRRIPVVDERGVLVGIVSERDLPDHVVHRETRPARTFLRSTAEMAIPHP